MKYTYVPSEERVREAMQQDEPMLAAITFDGEQERKVRTLTSISELYLTAAVQTGRLFVRRIIKAFHGKINELNDSIRMVLL